MNATHWDGKSHLRGPLAIMAPPAESTRDAPYSVDLLLIISSRRGTFLLDRDQVADFLSVHTRTILVCEDIDSCYSLLEAAIKSSRRPEDMAILFGVVKDCRLHDILLFDQLIQMALDYTLPEKRKLNDIISIHMRDQILNQGEEKDGESPGETQYSALTQGLGDPISRSEIVLRLYLMLRIKAIRIARHLKIPKRFIHDYGPLSLGLQGQGLIAIRHASRNGLRIRKDSLNDLRERCEEIYKEKSRQLRETTKSWDCFVWDGDAISRSNNGLPRENKHKLKAWLSKCAESSLVLSKVELVPPLFKGNSPNDGVTGGDNESSGDVSVVSDLWHDGLLLSKELRAWTQLWTVASALMSLKVLDINGVCLLKPTNDVLPD